MSKNKLPNILKANKKEIKSSKAEVNQRVKEIQQLKLSGFTRSYILEYSLKWGISEGQVDNYIAMATTIMKEINALSIQDNMAMICNNLWDLYRKASLDKNLSEQHKILMSIAKLKGLDQHAITHIIEDKRELSTISNEDLDALMDDHASH